MREHQTPKNQNAQGQSGATRSLSLLLCLGALAGVLIWAKLRLVTDIPRSAYADPKEREVVPDPDADDAQPEAERDEDDSLSPLGQP